MAYAFRAAAIALALLASACAEPRPITYQELAANPAYTRSSTIDVDAKTAHERVAELARLCWDDANMPASERALKTTGLVVAVILAGPAAGAMRTRRIATSTFDPETQAGIVMLRVAGGGNRDLGAIIETKPAGTRTEVKVVLKGEVDKMHSVAARWANGGRTCTGLTDREVK
ncbi:MAG: hypothetical protein KIT16_24295 [Rhodospirillaceae bacterium]|nr:hypothetical protein [Rhodospirillaceae bacterium]